MGEKVDSLLNDDITETIRLEGLCGDFMLDKDYNTNLSLVKKKISLAGSTILVSCASEYIPELDKSQRFVTVVKSLLDEFKDKKIYLIVEKSWKTNRFFESCAVEDIFYIDYYLGLTYLNNRDLTVTPWNKDSDKFLFLTGRWHRINRTTLLYHLWDRGLLERCEWSWSLTDEHGREMFPELTEEQYWSFIKAVTRSLDSWDTNGVQNDTTTISSQNYVSTMYSSKLFDLVSETKFEQDYIVPAFITEKTWKTIANGLPFVMAGPPGILESLENLGFDTFKDLLLIKNYDNPFKEDYLLGLENWMCMTTEQWREFYSGIRDVRWPGNAKLPDAIDVKTFRRKYPDIFQEILGNDLPPTDLTDKLKRLNAIIANVDHWLENLPKYADDVADRVLSNQERFDYLGKKVLNQLINWADRHNLLDNIKVKGNL